MIKLGVRVQKSPEESGTGLVVQAPKSLEGNVRGQEVQVPKSPEGTVGGLVVQVPKRLAEFNADPQHLMKTAVMMVDVGVAVNAGHRASPKGPSPSVNPEIRQVPKMINVRRKRRDVGKKIPRILLVLHRSRQMKRYLSRSTNFLKLFSVDRKIYF